MFLKSHTLNAFLDPKNVFLTLINIVIFLTIQVVFVWITASKTLQFIIQDNEGIAVDYYKRDETERSNFCKKQEETKATDEARLARIEEKQKVADERNMELIKKYLFPIWATLVGICVFCALLAIRRFDRLDLVTLAAIFAGFLTETFYYFVVFRNTQFFGKLELLAELNDPGSTEDYWSPVPGIYDKYTKVEQDGKIYYTLRST